MLKFRGHQGHMFFFWKSNADQGTPNLRVKINWIISFSCIPIFSLLLLCVFWHYYSNQKTECQTIYRKPHWKVTKLKSKFSLSGVLRYSSLIRPWRSQPRSSAFRFWLWHYECYLVSFVMYISGANFEEHCFNIFRDILFSVLYHFSSLMCIIQ